MNNNYNIIEKDDFLIGYKDDLLRYLKSGIIRLIDEGIGDLYINDIIEVIKELKKDHEEEVLKISPCQMGGYYIKELEEL